MCLGIPALVVSPCDDAEQDAMVEVSGIRRRANLALVLEEGESARSLLGQWVLLHVGFAMSRLDEQDAQKTLALLGQLGDLQEFAPS